MNPNAQGILMSLVGLIVGIWLGFVLFEYVFLISIFIILITVFFGAVGLTYFSGNDYDKKEIKKMLKKINITWEGN